MLITMHLKKDCKKMVSYNFTNKIEFKISNPAFIKEINFEICSSKKYKF
jgi:hypothetical protein